MIQSNRKVLFFFLEFVGLILARYLLFVTSGVTIGDKHSAASESVITLSHLVDKRKLSLFLLGMREMDGSGRSTKWLECFGQPSHQVRVTS